MADVYADPSAAGTNDGTSWSNAYTSLADAINALTDGDTLYSNADHNAPFIEDSMIIDVDNVNWYPGSGSSGMTVVTRLTPASSWVSEGGNIYSTALATKPYAVTYDFKQDDADGTVTGVDLRTKKYRAEANDRLQSAAELFAMRGVSVDRARAWYGFMEGGSSTSSPSALQWGHTGGRLYVNMTGTASPGGAVSLVRYVPAGNADFVQISGSNCTIHPGLVCFVNPDFNSNNGYGVKITGGNNSTISGVDYVYPGWHASGAVANAGSGHVIEDNCCLGMGVTGGNSVNPFVHYANQNSVTGRVGRDLSFVAYPLLNTAGAPLTGQTSNFLPRACYQHTDTIAALNGVEWSNVTQIDFAEELEAKHSVTISGRGQLAAVADLDDPADATDPSTYNVSFTGCVSVGRSGVASGSSSIFYDSCAFHRTDNSSYGFSFNTGFTTYKVALRGCVLYTGDLDDPNNPYFNRIATGDVLVLDDSDIIGESSVVPNANNCGGTFTSLDEGGTIALNGNRVYSTSSSQPWAIVRATNNNVWASDFDGLTSDGTNVFTDLIDFPLIRHTALTSRDVAWWQTNVPGGSADDFGGDLLVPEWVPVGPVKSGAGTAVSVSIT